MIQYAQTPIGRPPKFDTHDMNLMRQLRDGGMTLQKIANKFETTASHARLVCKEVQSPCNRQRDLVLSWMEDRQAMTVKEAIDAGLGNLGFYSQGLRHHLEALVKQGLIERMESTRRMAGRQKTIMAIEYKRIEPQKE